MKAWAIRGSRLALVLGLVGLGLSGLVGCDENLEEEIVPVPGQVLWDHTWIVESSSVQLKDGTYIPIPTDREFIEKLRYGEGGGPPTGDVLEGAEIVFEVDGRVLVRPVGASELQDYGTDYRVVEEGLLRASVRKSVWFKYEYFFDPATKSLLISPEEAGSASVLDLALDIISGTLYSGALDSAAGKVVDLLLEDPRVSEAIDAFLHDALNGAVADIPVQDPADITAWLIQLLRETGIVPPTVPDSALVAILTPIVEELLPLDRAGIVDALVEKILGSELVTSIDGERLEKVLRFALYRRTLERGQELASVEAVTLVLQGQ